MLIPKRGLNFRRPPLQLRLERVLRVVDGRRFLTYNWKNKKNVSLNIQLGVNFTNILQAAFSYDSVLAAFMYLEFGFVIDNRICFVKMWH